MTPELPAMTRAEFPAKFHAGAVFERPDGALLRIDIVDDEQIYFVSWRPGQETGCPIRMGLALFVEAWEREWEGEADPRKEAAS